MNKKFFAPRIILLSVFLLAQLHSFAQIPLLDSTKRTFSLGVNMLHFIKESDVSQSVFARYRINQHAFRVTMFTGSSSNNYFFGNRPVPYSITQTDSTIVSNYNYLTESQGGLSIGYEKFERLKNSDRLELYAGFGLYGGTQQRYIGHNEVTYVKDTLGVFQFNDSLSLISHPDYKNSFSGKLFGVIPYTGFLFNPDEIVSVGMELSLPILYSTTVSTDGTNKLEGFYFNTLLSVHVILNFDLYREERIEDLR